MGHTDLVAFTMDSWAEWGMFPTRARCDRDALMFETLTGAARR